MEFEMNTTVFNSLLQRSQHQGTLVQPFEGVCYQERAQARAAAYTKHPIPARLNKRIWRFGWQEEGRWDTELYFSLSSTSVFSVVQSGSLNSQPFP